MKRITALPHWIDPDFRVFEDVPVVADILVALVTAERERRPVFLRRGRAPELLPDDGGGFAVLLETSGTTGKPKAVRHSMERLRGRLRGLRRDRTSGGALPQARWLLTYDPASFAGLQVILTAAGSGGALHARGRADVATLAQVAAEQAVTHISATPSFWRGLLLAAPQPSPPLAVITLGGEAVDQRLLDALRRRWPDAAVRHIYASTEAGALFAVTDGREGFPAAWLADGVDGVRLAVRDGSLWVNSPRAMLRQEEAPAADVPDGWIDTGDRVAVEADRVLFRGRIDSRVNVGGVKVAPEEAEALILGVEGVGEALVTATPSPITGYILTATIVPATNADTESLRKAVGTALSVLPAAARPRVLSFADSIPLTLSGKKARGGS